MLNANLKKRTIFSTAQKCEICKIKEREPNLSNVSLAQRYNIGKLLIIDILSKKERWLAILRDQRKYINIEDEIPESAFTDEEIIDAILSADKEEKIIVNKNKSMPIIEIVSLKEAERL
ncbi:6563_t:CDS:2 [Funneliformis geosporum]|nr:6563_t:CDS:2 [Funneliformis geosporum]